MIRKVWDNVEEGALCLLLFFMVTITFVTVVTRYVFDLPLSYIDQLVPNLFVWVTFLGASAAVQAAGPPRALPAVRHGPRRGARRCSTR